MQAECVEVSQLRQLLLMNLTRALNDSDHPGGPAFLVNIPFPWNQFRVALHNPRDSKWNKRSEDPLSTVRLILQEADCGQQKKQIR
jgi:hypothetical protein